MSKRILLLSAAFAVLAGGCGGGAKVFISDIRLRGTVPPAVLTEEASAAPAVVQNQNGMDNGGAASLGSPRAIMTDLESRIGEDLQVEFAFSGKESPKAGPRRGMRVEKGQFVRLSRGRSQIVTQEADEHCVDDNNVCSTVWVHGRPEGGSLGAWYPIVVFDYTPPGE